MNKKLLKVLQDKCKDFGLTDKAIEELAESASEGLNDDSSDEDIEGVADSLIPTAKIIQGEITRKTRKQSPTPKPKPKPRKAEDDDDDEDGDEDEDGNGKTPPKWFREYKSVPFEYIVPLIIDHFVTNPE